MDGQRFKEKKKIKRSVSFRRPETTIERKSGIFRTITQTEGNEENEECKENADNLLILYGLIGTRILFLNQKQIEKKNFEEIISMFLKNEIYCQLPKSNILKKKLIYLFEKGLKKYLRESHFEYYIESLIVVERDEENFENGKKNCNNCNDLILLHATQKEFIPSILSSNLRVGKDCCFGLGVYFSDQIDYALYYFDNYSHFARIPSVGETIPIIASEVYYDKEKYKRVYDYNYRVELNKNPTEDEIFSKYKKKIVQKNGVHYVEVEGIRTQVIKKNGYSYIENKEVPKSLFVGREYVVTYQDQISPSYTVTLKRVEYCIIWRDPTLSTQQKKAYSKFSNGYKIYFEKEIGEALKLIWKKRYNKIILITSIGRNKEGRTFVDKVRKILEFDVMVMFFGFNVDHLDWIKNYPNSLFSQSEYTVKEFISNYNANGLESLKNKLENWFEVKFQNFKDNLKFPLFKKEGYYTEIDCSEYEE